MNTKNNRSKDQSIRPKKEKATKQFLVKLTESEYAWLDARALELGMPKSILLKTWIHRNMNKQNKETI